MDAGAVNRPLNASPNRSPLSGDDDVMAADSKSPMAEGVGPGVRQHPLVAEGVRFELTVGLHPRRFSRPVP